MLANLNFDNNRFLRGIRNLQRMPEFLVCFQQIENWRELIERYLNLSSKVYPFQVRTRNNLFLQVKDFYDVTTAWVVFCKQEYKVTSEHKVIVDLGANIGVFALFAVRQSPDAKVICFEPFPDTFRRLEDNIRINELGSQITCENLAVGGSRQSRVMATGGFGSTTSYLLESQSTDQLSDLVSCITFSDLLGKVEKVCSTQTIDLLKIDIEGAEYEFLENASSELLEHVKEIQMEYHPAGDKIMLFGKLEAAGLCCCMDWVFGDNFGMAHFKKKD